MLMIPEKPISIYCGLLNVFREIDDGSIKISEPDQFGQIYIPDTGGSRGAKNSLAKAQSAWFIAQIVSNR